MFSHDILRENIAEGLESIYRDLHDNPELYAGDWDEAKRHYGDYASANIVTLQQIFSDYYRLMGLKYKQLTNHSYYIKFLITLLCVGDDIGAELFETGEYTQKDIKDYYNETCQSDLPTRAQGSVTTQQFATGTLANSKNFFADASGHLKERRLFKKGGKSNKKNKYSKKRITKKRMTKKRMTKKHKY